MGIVAREGQTFARLQFNVGPGGSTGIPIEVDYRQPFARSDFDAWEQEYLANVRLENVTFRWRNGDDLQLESPFCDERDAQWYEDWHEYVEDAEFEKLKEGADEFTHAN